MRRHKYGAERTRVGNISFASKAEASRYVELALMEKAKAICKLKLQPTFNLVAGIRYRADFSYLEGDPKLDRLVVEDVKGFETPEFKLKAKLFKWFYPHVDFRIIKVKGGRK